MPLLLGASGASAQSREVFEERTRVAVLGNGLTLVVSNWGRAPVFSAALCVGAGSASEAPRARGAAHLLEHLLFRGTGNALNAALEEAGARDLNARTHPDFTIYSASLRSTQVETWAALESRRLLEPTFRELQAEKDVVIEEIEGERAHAGSPGQLMELTLQAALGAHPYASPVLGTPADVGALSEDDLREFFERQYVPGRIVVALAGRLDPEATIPRLAKYFERLPVKDLVGRPAGEFVGGTEPRSVVAPASAGQLYVEAYDRPAATDADAVVYDAIHDILVGAPASRLRRALVDRGYALDVGGPVSFPGERHAGLFVIRVIASPTAHLPTIRDRIADELRRLASESVSDHELLGFRRRVAARLARQLSSQQGVADALARSQTLWRDWREPFAYRERATKATASDIRRVARFAFAAARRTTAITVDGPGPGGAR